MISDGVIELVDNQTKVRIIQPTEESSSDHSSTDDEDVDLQEDVGGRDDSWDKWMTYIHLLFMFLFLQSEQTFAQGEKNIVFHFFLLIFVFQLNNTCKTLSHFMLFASN